MSREQFPSLEIKEQPKEKPKLTMYLLRHGESEEDKTKPNRGLTELGQTQVKEAMSGIFRDLIKENNPEFKDCGDPDKLTEAMKKAVKGIEFHLRDSGTDRTIQQVLVELEELKKIGVIEEDIYLPKAVFEYQRQKPDEKAGPGVAKRLKGVQGIDQNPGFRKLLKSPDYQKKVKATSEIMAWAKTPEEEVPENVETRLQMEKRYQDDITLAEKVIKRKTKGYPKRAVVIANSHASIATLAAAQELGVPVDKLMEEIGEVPNAEGLKYDFYEGDKGHQTRPFGKKIEQTFEQLKGYD